MSASSGLPFDDIRGLIGAMPARDERAASAAAERQRRLTLTPGAMGRLGEIAVHMAAWQAKPIPTADRPLVCVFAANHGVAARGVTLDAPDATRQALQGFSAGTGAVNQICAAGGLGFKAFDLALDLPTGDITFEPAMDEKACVATMAFGMEALAGGIDLLCLGDVGIGGTTIAAAIFTGLYGGPAKHWIGEVGDADDGSLARRTAAVDLAVNTHRAHLGDPLEVLRCLGGREIAAIAGAILAARLQRIPVVLDGVVTAAAAAILHALDPAAIAHCLAGQVEAEGRHAEVLARLGLKPILDLGLNLGEGAGAALAAGVVKAAVACHKGMAEHDEGALARRSI